MGVTSASPAANGFTDFGFTTIGLLVAAAYTKLQANAKTRKIKS